MKNEYSKKGTVARYAFIGLLIPFLVLWVIVKILADLFSNAEDGMDRGLDKIAEWGHAHLPK